MSNKRKQIIDVMFEDNSITNTAGFLNLPDCILEQILGYLPCDEIAKMRLVSSIFFLFFHFVYYILFIYSFEGLFSFQLHMPKSFKFGQF